MAKVSVIVPLHNKEDYVAETIQSVLAQTMTDWEMIVVENGSNDNGPEVVRRFQDPRIRLVFSPKLGPGAARNYGLDHAKGEWILFLDADDLIGPAFLSSRLSLLKGMASAHILAGRWTEFSESSNSQGELRLPEGEGRMGRWLEDAAIAFAPWAVHAVLVRRTWLPPCSWPEDLDGFASEDTAFWFPVVQEAIVAYTPDASALYRVLTPSSRNNASLGLWIDSVKAVTSRNIDYLGRSGMIPTSRQAIFLMKVFESCYVSAVLQHDDIAAGRSLALSRLWLKRCSCFERGVLARNILGIPLYQRIAHWILRGSSKSLA